ncbi:MAG: hypothetical protein ACI86M_001792, partial [Saprospiraceae bacterium]
MEHSPKFFQPKGRYSDLFCDKAFLCKTSFYDSDASIG